jgi:endonuclease III
MNELIINARKLAVYISNNSDISIETPIECPYRNHIGALFIDIIIQSGVNYRYVVVPRVYQILENYPQASSVNNFAMIIDENGLENVMKWNHHVKLKRMSDLILFCQKKGINYSEDLKEFLVSSDNREEFLKIKGIGKKTLDYLLKLLNIETVAVDRHIFSFVEEAGIESNNYDNVKLIVEYAADLMNISRRTIDYSIWSYKSTS